jgi:hypothetical protein
MVLLWPWHITPGVEGTEEEPYYQTEEFAAEQFEEENLNLNL